MLLRLREIDGDDVRDLLLVVGTHEMGRLVQQAIAPTAELVGLTYFAAPMAPP